MQDFFPILTVFVIMIVAFACWALLLLLLREVTCWYFKINRNLALLTEIRDLLRERGLPAAPPPLPYPPTIRPQPGPPYAGPEPVERA